MNLENNKLIVVEAEYILVSSVQKKEQESSKMRMLPRTIDLFLLALDNIVYILKEN